ncbi:7226_t:CDS:2 [Entrophospora sp. SA101]
MAQSIPEHFKPTQEELDRLQQSRIPSNTLQNTNKWVRVLNDWRKVVGYNYLLESLDDKDRIEKEVSEFIVGAKTKQNQVYSRSSLKNAVAGISRHLRNVKKDWNYNLCKKEHFPKLNGILDGQLKLMKKQGIGEARPYDALTSDEVKLILNHNVCSPNNPAGLLYRIFMWICLLGCARGGEHHSLVILQFEDTEDDPSGVNGPNYDIRLYLSKCPSHYKLTQNIEGINNGRTTSIQSIFNAGHEELKAMSISGHVSQPGIHPSSNLTSNNKSNKVNDVVSGELDVMSIYSEPEDEPDIGSELDVVNELDEDNEPDVVDADGGINGSGKPNLGKNSSQFQSALHLLKNKRTFSDITNNIDHEDARDSKK